MPTPARRAPPFVSRPAGLATSVGQAFEFLFIALLIVENFYTERLQDLT